MPVAATFKPHRVSMWSAKPPRPSIAILAADEAGVSVGSGFSVGVTLAAGFEVLVGVIVAAGVKVGVPASVAVGTSVGVAAVVGSAVGVGVPAIRVYCTACALPWSHDMVATLVTVPPPQML